MGDQALLQLIEVRQVELVPVRRLAGVTQQVTDFGSTSVFHVLMHRRVVGSGGVDHPFHLLLQVLGRRRLYSAQAIRLVRRKG